MSPLLYYNFTPQNGVRQALLFVKFYKIDSFFVRIYKKLLTFSNFMLLYIQDIRRESFDYSIKLPKKADGFSVGFFHLLHNSFKKSKTS